MAMKGRNGQTILANMFSVTHFTIVKLRKKTQKSDVSPMIKEAFQGVLATGDIAKKCGDNSFLIHRQPTKTDRKGWQFATVTIHFYFNKATCIRFAFFESVACVTAAVAQGATSLPGSMIPLWPCANKPLQVIIKSINHSTVVMQLVSCFLLSCHCLWKVGSCVGTSCSFSFLAPNVKVHPRWPLFIGA